MRHPVSISSRIAATACTETPPRPPPRPARGRGGWNSASVRNRSRGRWRYLARPRHGLPPSGAGPSPPPALNMRESTSTVRLAIAGVARSALVQLAHRASARTPPPAACRAPARYAGDAMRRYARRCSACSAPRRAPRGTARASAATVGPSAALRGQWLRHRVLARLDARDDQRRAPARLLGRDDAVAPHGHPLRDPAARGSGRRRPSCPRDRPGRRSPAAPSPRTPCPCRPRAPPPCACEIVRRSSFAMPRSGPARGSGGVREPARGAAPMLPPTRPPTPSRCRARDAHSARWSPPARWPSSRRSCSGSRRAPAPGWPSCAASRESGHPPAGLAARRRHRRPGRSDGGAGLPARDHPRVARRRGECRSSTSPPPASAARCAVPSSSSLNLNSPAARSTSSHRSVRISFLRQPVSSRRRSAATAAGQRRAVRLGLPQHPAQPPVLLRREEALAPDLAVAAQRAARVAARRHQLPAPRPAEHPRQDHRPRLAAWGVSRSLVSGTSRPAPGRPRRGQRAQLGQDVRLRSVRYARPSSPRSSPSHGPPGSAPPARPP